MTGNDRPQVRRQLFRASALARYQGPIELDVPHVLTPWRPGLVVVAALIALGVALLWL